VETALDNSN